MINVDQLCDTGLSTKEKGDITAEMQKKSSDPIKKSIPNTTGKSG